MTRRDPIEEDSAVDDLEHARHVLDRVQLFVGLAQTVEGPNRGEHRLALVEVGSDALREALALFDRALRIIGRRDRAKLARKRCGP